MRRLLLPFLTLLLTGAARAQNTPPTVTLELKTKEVVAGGTIQATVHASFAEGLHGYQNPPDPSYVLPVEIVAGDGTVLKSVSYPKGFKEVVAGVLSAVYSGDVSFPVVITAPKTAGKAKLNLTFKYQQCNEQTCYPPATVPLSAEVTVGTASIPLSNDVIPRTASSQAGIVLDPLSADLPTSSPYMVNFRMTPAQGLVIVGPIEVEGEGVTSTNVPQGDRRKIGAKTYEVYTRPEFAVTLGAPAEAGTKEIRLTVSYAQADGEGVFLRQTKTIAFNASFVAPQIPENNTTTARTTPPTRPITNEAAAETNGGLLGFLNNALERGNWALIIPAALLTGLALCLTPCVFPMIPITVTFFSNQGAKTNGGRFSLGLFYALGIAVTYGAAGGIAAASGGFVGELFTKPWFLFALGALMIVLALSMFDVYELRLPGFIQRNLKGRSGPVGALIMGLLMGFAAAPCAGALVLAVAVKVADIASIPVGVGMFGLIGLGMGLPFMVLATASSSAKALPKSGGWLKTTKAVLGLIVIYIAFDYAFKGFGMSPSEAPTQLAWVVVFSAFAAYLLFFDKSDPTVAVSRIKGVAAVGLGLFAGLSYSTYQQIKFDDEYAKLAAERGVEDANSQIVGKTINWIPYNDENFAKAVASGKPIMIDGRADWCTICHEMEARVFHTPEGLIALSGVYLLEIDWSTDVPKEYIDMTKKRFAIKGLPHVVFMEPAGKNEFSVGNIHDVAELKTHLRRVGAKL